MTPVSTGAQVQTPTPVKTKAAAIQKGEEPPPRSAHHQWLSQTGNVRHAVRSEGHASDDVADQRFSKHAAEGQGLAGLEGGSSVASGCEGTCFGRGEPERETDP